jgi:hypothetical protein
MKSDRARYDDGDDVRCRTCGAVFSHPSPVHWGPHFGAHHPSCRVPRRIRCGAIVSENSDGSLKICGSDASCWNEVNGHYYCYCDTHQEGQRGLKPITAMTKEVVADVLAQQEKELG